MFLLKKLIKLFFMPPTVILMLLVVGFIFVILGKRKKIGKYLLLGGVILYYFLSIAPTRYLLTAPLEAKYSPLNITEAKKTNYIVVLAGADSIHEAYPLTSSLGSAASNRLMEAIRLYHRMNQPRIVLSGGSGNPFRKVDTSGHMKDLLTSIGIPEEKLEFEISSRDTYENALETKGIVGSQRFILVTSANNMPRAMAVFKKLNMKPIPAPCDYQAGRSYTLLSFFPSGGNLEISTRAINEYLGIIWYRLRGRISA